MSISNLHHFTLDTFVNKQEYLFCSVFLTTFVNLEITSMNSRLQQFLSAENLTQSQLADRLGVAKASISHILAGRNKPGFDFIESLAQQFPELNLDWLIMGTGKMYKTALSSSAYTSTGVTVPHIHTEGRLLDTDEEDNLFSAQSEPELKVTHTDLVSEQRVHLTEQKAAVMSQNADKKAFSNIQIKENLGKHIVKVIVFYDDNTFKELK